MSRAYIEADGNATTATQVDESRVGEHGIAEVYRGAVVSIVEQGRHHAHLLHDQLLELHILCDRKQNI